MKLGTFKGGIHPRDGKDISKDLPIKEILPKGNLVYPIAQHIGAPAKPIVAVGDKVLVGQKIAESTGFISANIISSVSGTVEAIEPKLNVSGNKVMSIIIQNDNEYRKMDGIGEKRDYTKLSKDEIRNYIKEAGIVGLGGAGFPTHVKLTPKDDNAIDYVIVNAVECEPYLTSDYRVMLEMPEKVIGGLKVILSLFPKAKGIIAIEDNKPEAIKVIRKAVEGEDNITVRVLKTKYPQGAERSVIFATTGRKINSTMLPADAGCVVDNVDTVVSIYMAVCESTPLMRKIITVTGDAISNPRNFEVKIGTNYSELIEEAGGFKERPEKVISGGPMMGVAIFNLDVPVTKTTSALLCFLEDEVAKNEPTACIRCGRCVEVCPSNLIPQKAIETIDGLDNESFIAINGMECYECGSCTYICPAKRRITQAFKQSRKSVLDSRKKK
ncbi:MAG: electron transport complex subunit RsxC [Clostridium sp.]|uniref:electron transport complex subunit RsxC n=1 Tax=Clostridium sp. TaxID=1506 RepID=UPI0025C3B63E|nr:electron transport complex subunit RsxC [Clostridium sp.]MCF0147248.1 electron transport complex subunit RsxC [Clostridium sp.]